MSDFKPGKIRNTSNPDALDAMLILAEQWSGRSPIEAMESAGQRQLVAGEQLPTEMHGGTQADYEALGFTFGDVTPGDPLFRAATLPAGWSKRATDYSMGSEIVDDLGRVRVTIFYKAAFYDRRANMHLVGPSGYVAGTVYARRAPVLDDSWLTPDAAAEALGKLAAVELEQAADAEGYARNAADPTYWLERAAEHQQTKAFAEALIAQIGGTK
jgi:hypothetical protein